MINLTRKQYERLKVQNTTIDANEGYLFREPDNPNKMIKIISVLPSNKEYLEMKIHTINCLIKNRNIIGDIHIAIPEDSVAIDSKLRGCKEPLIEGMTLRSALDDYKIPLDTRINYLFQVGSILRDMDKIRRTTHLKNFYYNDIHEDNFIVRTDGIIFGVDIDSCSIEDNNPSIALYPSELMKLEPNLTKYHRCNPICEYGTDLIPDENLDLYCYIRMILNFMYGKPIDDLDKDKLFEYLNFLEYYGGNIEFLYCLERIYDDSVDNINPDYLLEHIKEIYPVSNYYCNKTGKLSKVLR